MSLVVGCKRGGIDGMEMIRNKRRGDRCSIIGEKVGVGMISGKGIRWIWVWRMEINCVWMFSD